jgi:hypothetical protein
MGEITYKTKLHTGDELLDQIIDAVAFIRKHPEIILEMGSKFLFGAIKAVH